jgi:hypothetical protein
MNRAAFSEAHVGHRDTDKFCTLVWVEDLISEG